MAVPRLAAETLARDNAPRACPSSPRHRRACSTASTSATCWNDSSRGCAAARVVCWSSAARRESARARCYGTCGQPPMAAASRAAAVESEMELAFAGLHALCAPMLGRLRHLPGPQQDALSTAFGLAAGPPPDRFLVGL